MGLLHCDHHLKPDRKFNPVKWRPLVNPEEMKYIRMRDRRWCRIHTKRADISAMAEEDKFREPPEPVPVPPQKRIVYADYRGQLDIRRAKRKALGLPKPLKVKLRIDASLSRSRTPTPAGPRKLPCYLEPLPEPERKDTPPPPKRPIPPFAPWPESPQQETQIWPGDLFSFDDDVEPMLEQLVGRCLEQGYMECQEDRSIEAMRAQQDNFEIIKICELDTWQRMRLAEVRVNEERERRLEQEGKNERVQNLLKIKMEATDITNGFLQRLKTSVIDSLEAKGMFKDPLPDELNELYFPGLINEMELEYNDIIKSRQTVDLMVNEIVEFPLYLEWPEDPLRVVRDMTDGIMNNIIRDLGPGRDVADRVIGNIMRKWEESQVSEIARRIIDNILMRWGEYDGGLGDMIDTTPEVSEMVQGIIDNILTKWRDTH